MNQFQGIVMQSKDDLSDAKEKRFFEMVSPCNLYAYEAL